MVSLVEGVFTISIRGMLTNKAAVFWMAAIIGAVTDAFVQSGSRAERSAISRIYSRALTSVGYADRTTG